MICIIAHLCWKVKGHGEASSALRKQKMIALIRLFCTSKASILAHRPEAGTIHAGMDTTCKWEFARIAELFMDIEALKVFIGRQIWYVDMRTGSKGAWWLRCPGASLTCRCIAPLVS